MIGHDCVSYSSRRVIVLLVLCFCSTSTRRLPRYFNLRVYDNFDYDDDDHINNNSNIFTWALQQCNATALPVVVVVVVVLRDL